MINQNCIYTVSLTNYSLQNFIGSFGGGGGGHHPIVHEQVIHVPKHHHHVKYVDKKEGLAELLEIALTALAFLSFGMFIVHVVMCISMTVSILYLFLLFSGY